MAGCWNNRMAWRTGAAVMMCACGQAMAQSAPPAPPAPPAAPALVSGTETTSAKNSWTIVTSDGDRSIRLRSESGVLNAEIDGKAVAADRIEQDGDTIRIRDGSGKVIFEHTMPQTETRVITRSWSSAGGHARALGGQAGGAAGDNDVMIFGPGGERKLRAKVIPDIAIETPKVMVGVQLIEPDSSLRGHLGLKPGDATLVSAVYEGLPAASAGLEPYDIIVGIAGQTPASPERVRAAIRSGEPGQAIKFEIIHRGERKTVTLTPEKYDGEKMEQAKVNAIAAVQAEWSQSGDPFAAMTPDAARAMEKEYAEAWAKGQRPMVGVAPTPDGKGQNHIYLWRADSAAQSEELAKRAQILAEQMREQAGRAAGNASDRAAMATELNKLLEERMRRMEEMMQQMMQRQPQPPGQPPEAPKPDEKKS